MIKEYVSIRFLLRNLHFYQQEKGLEYVNSHEFIERYFENPPSNLLWLHSLWLFLGERKKKEKFIKNKYNMILDCAQSKEHYVYILTSFKNQEKNRLESNIQITADGKSKHSVSALLFGNMDILLTILWTIIGGAVGAVATLLLQHITI